MYRAPIVRLGRRQPNSVAPAVFALVERGAMKRPELADRLRFSAELRFLDVYPSVRLMFTRRRNRRRRCATD